MFMLIEFAVYGVIIFAILGLYGKLDEVLKVVHRLEQQAKPANIEASQAP